MEQVVINQLSLVMPAIPAGVAIRDVSGGADITLSSSEAAADIIILQGVLTASIKIIVPTALVPTQVNNSNGLASGWVKIFRNNCTGGIIVPFTISPVAPFGVAVPLSQAKSQLFWSPDGITSFPGADAVT